MQEINIETCQKKKKKQKDNTEEINIKTWQKWKEQARRVLKKYNIGVFLYIVKMSYKILKFNDFEVNKKEFRDSEESVALNLVDIDKIVISDKI